MQPREDTKPWWKYGYFWLVVGLPLSVVVASMITVYIAFQTQDEVYKDEPGVKRVYSDNEYTVVPAMQARNHAATGGIPKAAK